MTHVVTRTVLAELLDATPPDDVRGIAAGLVRDVVLAARRDADQVSAVAAALDPVGERTVTAAAIGGGRWAAPEAALLNAAAACHRPTGAGLGMGRLGRAVAAAALAQAEVLEARSEAVVDAVAVGAELGVRLAAVLGSDHAERGWDTVGTAGPAAAALACLRLVDPDPAVAEHALGIAVTQAAGLQAARGTPSWALHAGCAARAGVAAVGLAGAGFTGPRTAIEGRRGLLAVLAPGSSPMGVVDGLTRDWRLTAVPLGSEVDDGHVPRTLRLTVDRYLDGRALWNDVLAVTG